MILNLPELWSNPEAAADQHRFIRSPKRISCAATGSKTGKTFGGAVWCIEQMAKHPPGTLGWWVGPFWRTVEIGYNRVKAMLPESHRKANDSKMRIEGSNGVTLEFRSAEKPDTLFGEAVAFLFFDEGPRARREAWQAVQTTMMQTQGPIRIAGNTDRGRNNWFYEECLRGMRGDPEVDFWSIKTYENPHISKDFVEKLRASLTERAWKSLIEAEFVDDASAVFRNIDACLVPADWQNHFTRTGVITPWLAGHAYGVGVDLGKFTDYTFVVVTDLWTGEVVYVDRYQRRDWPSVIENVMMVSRMYNSAPIHIDSTGAGEPIFEELRQKGANVRGYKFTNISKQQLIERLALFIEKEKLRIPSCATILIEELHSYEYEISDSGNIKFSAPGAGRNIHDDGVIALALAAWLMAEPYEIGYVAVESRPVRAGQFSPSGGSMSSGGRMVMNANQYGQRQGTQPTRWGNEKMRRRWR